jgi:2'-5' RNA ligase
LAAAVPSELFPSARWVPIENQHITLRFLGSCPEERMAEIGRACAPIVGAVRGHEVSVDGLGVFPDPRRARVLWAGIRDREGVLTTLETSLGEVLGPLGWPPEDRDFTPHLTLARFAQPARVTGLPTLAGPPGFPIASVRLFRSHLGRGGASYETIEDLPLA